MKSVNLHQAQTRCNSRALFGMFSLSTAWEDVQCGQGIQTCWEERVKNSKSTLIVAD
jgi:hypothetical protein